MILAGAWHLGFRAAHLTTLKPLDLRGKACMWLDELDAELVKTETLQGLCLLHIPTYFVKSIRNAVSSGAWSIFVSATITIRGSLCYCCLCLVSCGATSIVGVKIDISRASSLPYVLLASLVITTCLSLEWITAV